MTFCLMSNFKMAALLCCASLTNYKCVLVIQSFDSEREQSHQNRFWLSEGVPHIWCYFLLWERGRERERERHTESKKTDRKIYSYYRIFIFEANFYSSVTIGSAFGLLLNLFRCYFTSIRRRDMHGLEKMNKILFIFVFSLAAVECSGKEKSF